MSTELWTGGNLNKINLLVYSVYDNQLANYKIENEATIGRLNSPMNPDVQVNSPIVSRLQGRIYKNMGFFFYEDSASTNGTYVNGVLHGKMTGNPSTGEDAKLGCMLNAGDVLRIDNANPSKPSSKAVIMIVNKCNDLEIESSAIDLSNAEDITIGRNVEGVVLDNNRVSARHAMFGRVLNGWYVEDLDSTNGVYVNNSRIEGRVRLYPLDVVRIVDYTFIYTGDALIYFGEVIENQEPSTELVRETGENAEAAILPEPEPESIKVPELIQEPEPVPELEPMPVPEPISEPEPMPVPEPIPEPEPMPVLEPIPELEPMPVPNPISIPAPIPVPAPAPKPDVNPIPMQANNRKSQLVISIRERSVKKAFRKQVLLKDINLCISHGEMVMLLGGSGAGKTTFINAVMGYEKADGTILHDDVNVYKEYSKVRKDMGFVPQQDLLRLEDTVYNTLENAAQMKMSPHTTDRERAERIEVVLNSLGLTRERENKVKKLSGGQRKRLSIAVELISNPSLFFLDEPDSGLDGIMARSLMEQLRTIADEGKIVMVITHAPDRVKDLFNKVIVLAKGEQDNVGHLAFFGDVNETMRFFGTDSLEGVIRRINRVDEGGEGKSDYYISKYERGEW